MLSMTTWDLESHHHVTTTGKGAVEIPSDELTRLEGGSGDSLFKVGLLVWRSWLIHLRESVSCDVHSTLRLTLCLHSLGPTIRCLGPSIKIRTSHARPCSRSGRTQPLHSRNHP